MFIDHRIENILISNLIDVLLATSVFYFCPHKRPSTEINQRCSVASFSHCPFGWTYHPFGVSLKWLNRYPASMGDWILSLFYTDRSNRMVILYLIPFDSRYGATRPWHTPCSLMHSNENENANRKPMLDMFICSSRVMDNILRVTKWNISRFELNFLCSGCPWL